MQVHPDVYRWLGVLGMMEAGKLTPPASKRTGKVMVPDDLSDHFENGQGFGELMSKLGAMRGMPPAPIDTFRDGVSPVVRLYNWNLLAPVFKPFGIVMDKTTKTLVVAGDLDAVANVLEKFYERTVGELPPIMPKVVHALKPKRSNTPDVFNGVIDNGGSMLSDPAPITSRITASMKNARLQRPALVDPAGRSLIDMNDDPMWTNSPTKMPGEKGPPEKPLRGADEEDDPFGFLQDPDAPKTPLELLGKSIEASFGLGKGEGETLLSRQPGTFIEWMKGLAKPPKVKGPNAAATHWLDGIRTHSKTLALLLTGPPENPEEPSEGYVASVFDAIGAGLYNKNAGVVSSTVKALKSVARHIPKESQIGRASCRERV